MEASRPLVAAWELPRRQSSARERACMGVLTRPRWASSGASVSMGMSVVVKVEMLYWLGSLGEVSCWPPLRRWRRMVWASGVLGVPLTTMAWAAVVMWGSAGVGWVWWISDWS